MQDITLFIVDVSDKTFFRMTRMTNNQVFFKCTVPKSGRDRFSYNPMDRKQTVWPPWTVLGSTGSNFTRVGVRP